MLECQSDLKGKNIVVPLCGGNIDTTVLGRVLERGLAADDRMKNFTATVSDRRKLSQITSVICCSVVCSRPFNFLLLTYSIFVLHLFYISAGGIGRLTSLLGEHGASIKDMYHERAFLQSNIDFVKVKCVVELQGLEHARLIDKMLEENGYDPVWDGD